MKALITGITGFAGTHLAEHLLACGDEVLGCSQNGKWHDSAPPELPKRVRLLRWDIANRSRGRESFSPERSSKLRREWEAKKTPDPVDPSPSEELRDEIVAFAPDVVYHLAGWSVPARCGTAEPTPEALEVNVEGTRRVIELASQIDFPPRLLLVSSRHVYGPEDLKNNRASETPWPHPQSGYGKTKLQAEWLAREMMETHGVGCVIARAFNHAGPRQLPPLMLAQWCEQLARGQNPLSIRNDNTWMDLCDVRDVVRAYRLLAVHGEPGEVFNVGSGKRVRTGHIARQLVKLASPGCRIESLSHDEHHNPIASIAAVKRLTSWRAEIPLEKTLADAWESWVERAARSD